MNSGRGSTACVGTPVSCSLCCSSLVKPTPQGPPGEVTAMDLDNAIAGTANNVNGVSDLSGLVIGNPPTQAQVETIRVKLNELINALYR
jgi:hypothetical protein